MSKKQGLKTGEKVLFGIIGVFILLAVMAYIALESVRLTSEKPMFQVKASYDFTDQGAKGSAIFRKSRCTDCHRALRNGTNMGLSLDGVGSNHSYDWIYSFLTNPEKTYGSPTLDHGPPPKEAAYVSQLPDEDLKAIARFISELKAEQGSSSAPVPPKGRSEFIDNMVKTWAPQDWKEKYSDVRKKNTSQAEIRDKE